MSGANTNAPTSTLTEEGSVVAILAQDLRNGGVVGVEERPVLADGAVAAVTSRHQRAARRCCGGDVCGMDG